MDPATFQIEDVMIHDVPRGGRDLSGMTLTDAPIGLDGQLRGYFHGKIVNSLQARGVEVVADPTQEGHVRDSVAAVLRGRRALPEQSKNLARWLHHVQKSVNPPGLLTVMTGTVDGRRAVSVLKLEREQGIRFRVRRTDGGAAVDLEFLRDLMLTNKTKVFKTSLFLADDPADPLTVHGWASDDQRGMTEGRGVADFFLSAFLGMQLRVNPARATLDFVRAAEDYFNAAVENPEKRGRYQVALLATMQDQRLDIMPRAFAATHLDTADRPGFLERVEAAGLNARSAFEKDLSLVRVEGFKMTFEHGMVLVGQAEDLRERVRIRRTGQGLPGVDVNDVISQLRGR